MNLLRAVADPDGSVTLDPAADGAGLKNHLYIMDGWDYAFRLCHPRAAVLDGTWKLPEIRRMG